MKSLQSSRPRPGRRSLALLALALCLLGLVAAAPARGRRPSQATRCWTGA